VIFIRGVSQQIENIIDEEPFQELFVINEVIEMDSHKIDQLGIQVLISVGKGL
jgi:hypothetical protein